MGEQVVRDKSGNVLGRIRKLGDGRYELRDRLGNVLGFYDEKRDRTLDKNGNVLGYGNLLGSLIPKR
ncbi:MAG: hypothetical protein K8H90_08885 [Thermoanaerobaculia bacterium]|nr:hypothetical protein [Thermoanaerobaculia bacterium]